MSKQYSYHIRAFVLIESAIISTVTLSLFLIVIAITERVNLYNYSNQIIEKTLSHQALNIERLKILNSNDFDQNYINKYVNLILNSLVSKNLNHDDFLLESELLELRNNSIYSVSHHKVGSFDSFNQVSKRSSIEIVRDYYLDSTQNGNYLFSTYQNKFLSNSTDPDNLSTVFIFSRLFIKNQQGVLSLLNFFGLANYVYVEKVVPLKLNYYL